MNCSCMFVCVCVVVCVCVCVLGLRFEHESVLCVTGQKVVQLQPRSVPQHLAKQVPLHVEPR